MIDRSTFTYWQAYPGRLLPPLPCSAWQAAQLAAHLWGLHKKVSNLKTIWDIGLKI